MIALEPKMAAEVRDYTHDWTPFLGTDTISSQTTTVSGVTLDSAVILSGNRAIKFWVSAGTDGGVGTITNTIISAGGRTETEVFTIRIDAGEPISLAEAKDQVRVTDTTEDDYIGKLIPAARRYVENRSGIIIKRRQFTENQFPVRGAIRLSNGPLVLVDTVAYPDTSGTPATYAGARIVGQLIYPVLGAIWPAAYPNEGFTVTYTAGLSTALLGSDDYSNLLHAMKLLIGHWHSNREAVAVDQRGVPTQVPLAVDDLCDQVRMVVA
jgi:uncharacterized phiE125 gp8 family phage protein